MLNIKDFIISLVALHSRSLLPGEKSDSAKSPETAAKPEIFIRSLVAFRPLPDIGFVMTPDLQEASSEVSRDLSPEWLELSSRVRRLAIEAQSNSGSPLADHAIRLCDHVERLHSDVEALLVSLSTRHDPLLEEHDIEPKPEPEPEEINRENLKIQREMHQESDLRQVIKALFMWKDDPVDRVREKVD